MLKLLLSAAVLLGSHLTSQAVLAVITSSAAASASPAIDAIKVLENVGVKPDIFENRRLEQPIVIRKKTDVARFFGPDSVEKVLASVDFQQQAILIFAWSGSGQDQLDYLVQESYPETILFEYRRGLTRDLRTHFRAYVVRLNVNCRLGDQEISLAEKTHYVRVEICGILNSQIMAIGGETTGVQITAGEIQWELDFTDPQLKQKAEALHEKTVIVKGELNFRQGVEIPQRWIVTANSLMESPSGQD